ncbi:MAG TPA: hypothetical protein VFE23_15350 [Usitatibacter sp.]|nr:hypothetical protein [Usitatibacter sp.]
MAASYLFLAALVAPAVAYADLETGRKLVEEKHCEACHDNKTMGVTGAIYRRRDHHVTSFAKLRSQVAACNSELGLGLFPDEEEHVVEYLDATYYHLGSAGAPAK